MLWPEPLRLSGGGAMGTSGRRARLVDHSNGGRNASEVLSALQAGFGDGLCPYPLRQEGVCEAAL